MTGHTANALLSTDEHDLGVDAGPGLLRNEILNRSQLAGRPRRKPLIEGVLERDANALLIGRDSSYKTFTALDWGLCIAAGKPWKGRVTEQGHVLYITGEGPYDLHNRITAWELAGPMRMGPIVLRQSFQVLPRAINLYTGTELNGLLELVEDKALVVIDTLRRASGGADGNSSGMGAVVDNIEKIKRATANGTVLTPAHTDKGDNSTRGFSGIEDDADIVWHSKRDEDNRFTLTCRKMKNGPEGTQLDLQVEKVGPSLVISRLV